MPLDHHVRVVAWLHIALGVFWVGVIGLIGLFFGAFGAIVGSQVHGQDAGILAWIAGFGASLLLFAMAFPALEILGGALLLGGSAAGKAITILFSVVELINVPIGTAIGIYSLWALMREVPVQPGVVVEPGMRGN